MDMIPAITVFSETVAGSILTMKQICESNNTRVVFPVSFQEYLSFILRMVYVAMDFFEFNLFGVY